MRTLELLAPAKNCEIGRQAILHGADAVYIGAPRFSARAAAGNPLNELAGLIRFAHLYRAKVYVALNTLLTDDELPEALQLAHELHAIGTDALIVQDMGLLEMDLPPIALHASTQCDNRTPEKVKFLADTGFEQVVLARELSLERIAAIHAATPVRLEAFVHGALCVSYSGQCYAGEALAGRSANRGVCPQICRLPFDLQDANGRSLGHGHWLSLKDLNLSGRLAALIEAGVSSFKIEGRLKDMDYVKNITALYSQLLNDFIASRPGFRRASDGESRVSFRPDALRTFNRGYTEYFTDGRRQDIFNPLTPKSMGEPIGRVTKATPRRIEVDTDRPLANGDGFCYAAKDELKGFRANRAEGRCLYPANATVIEPGTLLYRNEDTAFAKLLSGETAERRIAVQWLVTDASLQLTDGETTVEAALPEGLQPALRDPSDTIRRTLAKLGDTPFSASGMDIRTRLFLPASTLTALRRRLTDALSEARLRALPAPSVLPQKSGVPFPSLRLDYRGNVHNAMASAFYRRHGVTETEPSFEREERDGVPVMYCKHCIRFAIGACPKQRGRTLDEPLHLIHGNYYLRLDFDCKRCEMRVVKES